MNPRLKRRRNVGLYGTLLAELLKEEYNYNFVLRMTSEIVEEIFQLIKDNIPKENTNLRELPIQSITCCHNWLFINRGVIQELWS